MITIALVGRPNVGKSTLFNRLIGKQLAIVHDMPGVTRDWREAETEIADRTVRILDTAGYDDAPDHTVAGRMRGQTDDALDQADIVLFVLDGRQPLTAVDLWTGGRLRRADKPILVLLNKAENINDIQCEEDALAMGFGMPIHVSAAHGEGIAELISTLNDMMPEEAETQGDEESNKRIKIALIGQPNAGKSTLMNALLGSNRSLTGPEPGLTRDAVHAHWVHNDRAYELVDTAGLRRKAKVHGELEDMAVEDSLRAIRLAQIVILVVDQTLPTEHQDVTLAGLVVREGRGLIVAMNKSDLPGPTDAELAARRSKTIEESINEVSDLPIVQISALRGKRIDKLMAEVERVYDLWNKRVPTSGLNRWLEFIKDNHPAPMVRGRPNNLRYVSQINSRPPTFALFCSQPKDMPDSYKRFLIKTLRRDFELPSVPIRLLLRGSKKNPFVS